MSAAPVHPEAAAPAGEWVPPRRGLVEVPAAQVKLRGGFWGPRLDLHRRVTIPHVLDCLEKHGHVTNFDKAAGRFEGPLQGHGAFDSDLHKALEGALYSLQDQADEALLRRVESILDRVLAAQQPDGFLIAYHIVRDLSKRWDDLRLGHQMYNAGHFFEMAAEHARLTGDARVLEAARRFADHIDRLFGIGKRYDVDGHQEVELALVKLYRATGERRYLELSRFFLDERGYAHGTERKPFDPASQPPPVKPEGTLAPEQRREFWHAQLRYRNGRMQDHKPVVDQHEAIGHAVRAGYLYAAMADTVRFMEAPGFEPALDDIWADVVGRKMYLTGGIGSGQYDDEGFGDPYRLPNDTAYCESCAAIAHVLWQHRMALLKGDARYADLAELALYNGTLAGLAVTGDHFFYENHLVSREGDTRRPWIGIACCPTNLARIVPQVGGLAYACGSDRLCVNLYAAGEAALVLGGGASVTIAQQTEYPWDGRVRLTVAPERPMPFELCLRIPGWAQGRPVPSDLYRFGTDRETEVPPVKIAVNGRATDPSPAADGYLHLSRRWQSGDAVELELPMPVQRVYAHAKVEADRGRVALMRGPILYCIEAADHPGVDLFSLRLPRTAELRAEPRPELLGGVTVLTGEALAAGNPIALTAIPYYAWANREKGPMTVWLGE